jgi:hypothetical protein
MDTKMTHTVPAELANVIRQRLSGSNGLSRSMTTPRARVTSSMRHPVTKLREATRGRMSNRNVIDLGVVQLRITMRENVAKPDDIPGMRDLLTPEIMAKYRAKHLQPAHAVESA